MFKKQIIIRIGQFKYEFIPLIITSLGTCLLLSLGFWQLSRLKEKTDFINSVSNNLSNPAIIYNKDSSYNIYQKIKLSGHFLNGKNIFLYGRKAIAPEKEGYYLLAPFQTIEGKIIMVARGWFATKNKALINVAGSENIDEISGIILPLEHKKIFIPNNDLKNNVWFTLEHRQMIDYVGSHLENFYLLQLEPANLPPQIIPIDANNLVHIKNDHLEYALTWFSLAICLGVIFFIYVKRKNANN